MIAPQIVRILRSLGAGKVCDLGAGNGALAAWSKAKGFQVAGIEPDDRGREIARSNRPDIHFYGATWPSGCGGHIKFWSRRTLTALLEDNGFRGMGFSGAGRVP
jgi:predicted RNA methylase